MDTCIQIQHLLKLNLVYGYIKEFVFINSNTTLVKVKLYSLNNQSKTRTIQIQHLLKLNHLRKTNKRKEYFIQIQHLLKLNFL